MSSELFPLMTCRMYCSYRMRIIVPLVVLCLLPCFLVLLLDHPLHRRNRYVCVCNIVCESVDVHLNYECALMGVAFERKERYEKSYSFIKSNAYFVPIRCSQISTNRQPVGIRPCSLTLHNLLRLEVQVRVKTSAVIRYATVLLSHVCE